MSSTPPPSGPGESDQSDPTAPPAYAEPISLSKPADEPAQDEQPFDPYRFGAPEHPVPPEYAPPGYVPPQPAPRAAPPPGYGAPTGYPAYQPFPTSPPPGAQFGYPPPPFGPYQQPKTGNGKAIAGMVLGIVSIVFFWLSVLDAVPVILGLVFSILGLNEAKRIGHGRRQAIAGIICASIGAVLAIVLSIVIWTRIAPCRQLPSGSAEFNSCVNHHF